MKRFEEPAWLTAFERDLEALCKRHAVILEHEDGHGSGIVRRVRQVEDARCEIALTAVCSCGWRWNAKLRDHDLVAADPHCAMHGEP